MILSANLFNWSKLSLVFPINDNAITSSSYQFILFFMDDKFPESKSSSSFLFNLIIGIFFKGNNSLHLTNEYGLYRYSFKIEFDHFQNGYSYHGLDKLSLDASFQDNSYLKTKLSYEMFEMMGVVSPLTSFVFVSINGNDFGLYLAIEEIEDSFLARNFGYNHGQLYKPDYRNFEDPNLDIGLNYIGEDPKLYPGIFDNARTNITLADKKRLIKILKAYHENDYSGLEINLIIIFGLLLYRQI